MVDTDEMNYEIYKDKKQTAKTTLKKKLEDSVCLTARLLIKLQSSRECSTGGQTDKQMGGKEESV